MKNRIIKIVSIGLLIIFVVVMVILNGGDESLPIEETVSDNTIVTTEPVSNNSVTVNPTNEPTQDRTLHFDNNIVIDRGEESYIEDAEDILIEESGMVNPVDNYDFSNGFVIKDTDNIRVASYGFNEGLLYGDTPDTIIRVEEKDALTTTVQQLREETLYNLGMNYYFSCHPSSIPLDADVTIGEGVADWESYYEELPYKDPTVEDWCQVLWDTVTDTAFGGALYLEVYLPYEEKYVAYAFILCERSRILSISIEDKEREYLLPYLVELTNESISLVK